MIKKKYKVDGMHCPSCALTIEWELEDVGVKAKCHYAKRELEVEFAPEKISEENIRQVVKKSGYLLDN